MKIFLAFLRGLISLRYKVKIDGAYKLENEGPVLVFPNHVALVDPAIVSCFLGKYLHLQPVASEKFYNKPVFKQFLQAFETIPIGEMDAGADSSEVKKVFEKVVDSLKSGKNILIYPSGQIYRQGYEAIIGKQSAYNIAKMMPADTKVILVKTRGLWGSMFSTVWDNGETSLPKLILFSLWLLFANLLFFVPKREVTLEIDDITDKINEYKNKDLGDFNMFLEGLYNEKKEVDGDSRFDNIFIEKVNYLKHYFYYNDVDKRVEPKLIKGSLKEMESHTKYDLRKIPDEVKHKIKEKISSVKDIKIEKIDDNSKIILDLFFDSLDLAEIKSYIQANFDGASNPPINELKSVGDLYIMAVGKSKAVEKLKDCDWGESIGEEVFLVEKLG